MGGTCALKLGRNSRARLNPRLNPKLTQRQSRSQTCKRRHRRLEWAPTSDKWTIRSLWRISRTCVQTRGEIRQVSRAQARQAPVLVPPSGQRAILMSPHHLRAREALAQEHNPTATAQAGHRLACSLLHSSFPSLFPSCFCSLAPAAPSGRQAAGRGGQRACTLSDDDFQFGEVGTALSCLALSIPAAP